MNYDLKPVPKVKTNILEDVIGNTPATKVFKKLSPLELNSLFCLCEYMNCEGLKNYIASTVACRIFMSKNDEEEFEKKKAEFNIKVELNNKWVKENA